MPKLYILIFELKEERDLEAYGNLRMRLQGARAKQLLHGVYALRSEYSAIELKDAYRKALNSYDRIIVFEIAGEWASRRAGYNLADL